jgi:adenylate kinase
MLAYPPRGNDAEYLSQEPFNLPWCTVYGTRDPEARGTGLAGQARCVVLLGPPGSGKGTQAVRLAARFGVPHIATGDIFRESLRQVSPLGRAVKRYLDAGELVPDHLVIGIVSDRLEQPDCRRGFVLDGFPRSAPQARALTRRLDELGTPLDAAISLEVQEAELSGRLTARARADDNEQTIRRRLRVSAASNGPLLRYYQQHGLLVRVDGVGHPDQITERLVASLEGLLADALTGHYPVEAGLALLGSR